MNERTAVWHIPKPDEAAALGEIALDGDFAVFEYGKAYAGTPWTLNPFWKNASMTASPIVRMNEARRLHGVFADSLPDAWGRAVLRRRLVSDGIDFEALPAPQQLQIIGTNAPGALCYRPAHHDAAMVDVELDHVANEADALLEGSEVADVASLALLAGSSGGARPKILVERVQQMFRSFKEGVSDGDHAWIVKLPSRLDLVDIGPLEAAYADMARDAGLTVAASEYLPSQKRPFGYFATKRFDRGRENRRVHFTSFAGLLDLHWHEPSLTYAEAFKVVRYVTKSQTDVEAMFRRMVFNVAAHNRDDHSKQHACFNHFDGTWSLTPSFDLTYAPGPGGEHYLSVCGRGKDITAADLHTEARAQRIAGRRCGEIIDQVTEVVRSFKVYAARYGVSSATTSLVASATQRCLRSL